MAEKHKSKYKAPKDLEKSQKPKARKDLKDYTEDDKNGSLNPKSTGDKQLNVLRKTDKEVIDTGDMYVKYNADDRLYKDLEDGEYDPKHAAKVLKKRQDKDEKDNEKNIKDKIENLTREQRERLKERLVREYIRKKISSILLEADETESPEDEAPTEPTPEAPADTAAAPTDTPPATPEPPAPAAPVSDTTAAPEAPAPEQTSPEDQERNTLMSAGSELENENTVRKVDGVMSVLRTATKNSDLPDQIKAYKLLRWKLGKKIMSLQGKQQSSSSNE